ncbi:MAG: uroporphyrinogen decarboxylase family protein [Dehalococcoidia bacterium]|nr:uroporphyrinogen decarboxylase family protein [Dehalococcoidia bacterium]
MERQYSGKDHMAAVFGGEATDRIPVRAMQTLKPALELAGVTGKEVRTEPDKYIKAMVALQEVVPSDAIVILVGDDALFANIVGLSFEELKALGMRGKPLLGDKSTFAKIELREPKQYERLLYHLEICEKAISVLPDVIIDAFTISPWTAAMMLRGMENFIFDTKDDPQFAHDLLRFTTEFAKMVGDALLETGIGLLTVADPNAGSSVISPKMFREWAKPYLEETVTHFKRQRETPIFLHICGYTDPIMEDLVSLGIDGMSIDDPSSLKRLVEISQGRIVIEGNFPTELYVIGTKDQIDEKVKECIDTAAEPNGYKYILCSGCQVPDNAPIENVKHFLEFGRQYGRYS